MGKEAIGVKIGFIGLGVMGRPMAGNLLRGGRSVTVFNRSRAAVSALVQGRAEAGESPRDLAERCDVVITMLPDSPDVRSVLCGLIEIGRGRVGKECRSRWSPYH